jgi:hypothetical protein
MLDHPATPREAYDWPNDADPSRLSRAKGANDDGEENRSDPSDPRNNQTGQSLAAAELTETRSAVPAGTYVVPRYSDQPLLRLAIKQNMQDPSVPDGGHKEWSLDDVRGTLSVITFR